MVRGDFLSVVRGQYWNLPRVFFLQSFVQTREQSLYTYIIYIWVAYIPNNFMSYVRVQYLQLAVAYIDFGPVIFGF